MQALGMSRALVPLALRRLLLGSHTARQPAVVGGSCTTHWTEHHTRESRKRGPWVVAAVRGAGGLAGGNSKGTKQRYLCQECGEDFPQRHGQCPACKAWESMAGQCKLGPGLKAPGFNFQPNEENFAFNLKPGF